MLSCLKQTPRITRYTAAFLWTLAILALSLLPAGFFLKTGNIVHFSQADKIVHAILYGILTALLLWATTTTSSQPPGFRRYGLLAAAATTYGLILDLLQNIVTTTRSTDLWDVFANAVGAFLVAGVSWWMARRARARGAGNSEQ